MNPLSRGVAPWALARGREVAADRRERKDAQAAAQQAAAAQKAAQEIAEERRGQWARALSCQFRPRDEEDIRDFIIGGNFASILLGGCVGYFAWGQLWLGFLAGLVAGIAAGSAVYLRASAPDRYAAREGRTFTRHGRRPECIIGPMPSVLGAVSVLDPGTALAALEVIGREAVRAHTALSSLQLAQARREAFALAVVALAAADDAGTRALLKQDPGARDVMDAVISNALVARRRTSS